MQNFEDLSKIVDDSTKHVTVSHVFRGDEDVCWEMFGEHFLTPECDNRTQAHMMLELTSAPGGSRAYCRLCRRLYYLRHNKHGAPEKRQYAKLFYRDIVQRNKPLFYKIHRDAMQLGDIM